MLAFEQFQTKGTSCQTFTQDNFSNAEAYHSQYTLQRQHGGLYHLKIDSSTSSSLLFFRAPSTLFDASLQTQRANRSQTFTVASAPCQETHHLLWGIDWIKKKKKKSFLAVVDVVDVVVVAVLIGWWVRQFLALTVFPRSLHFPGNQLRNHLTRCSSEIELKQAGCD